MAKNNPRLCVAGIKLRDQVNKNYPARDKASDGWIGDTKHQKTKSDHNPDSKGIVRALDIDADLGKGYDSLELAESLRNAAKNGDKRISYIIHKKKIASKVLGWKWRAYVGSNPHISHIHISFTELGDNDKKAFDINIQKVVKEVKTPITRTTAYNTEIDAIKIDIIAIQNRLKKLEDLVKKSPR
jgi:hypothetical protein